MSVKSELKKLLKQKSDIEVVEINDKEIVLHLPYETALVDISLEGDSDEERIELFKENLNSRLQNMIDHLEECKLD
ncbi:hypothetical protein [Paenibacillus medicaginis]|uniref:Uncharacterized protein n=1 Tax=Paenibacillus medicaginis TaxID=1470560 RepID=A0ABV5BV50_9BACL